MHISASKPVALDEGNLDKELIRKEKEIFMNNFLTQESQKKFWIKL